MTRRRALRLAAVTALVLVGLAAAGLAALPEIARRLAVWRLAAATGRQVAIERLDLSLVAGRLELRGLTILDPDRTPLARLGRLEVRLDLRPLLRGHLAIDTLAVEGLMIRVVRTGPGRFNLSDLLGRRGGGGQLPVTVRRLAVAGEVVLEDRTLQPPRTWRVEALSVEGRDVSTAPGAPPGAASLRAVVAGSPVTLTVTGLRGAPLSFRAALTATAVDASLAALYLPPASPLSPARGVIDAALTVEHDAAAGTRAGLEARLAGIDLHRPEQARPFLSLPAARVAVEGLRAQAGKIELDRLAVAAGAVALEDQRLGPARRWQIQGLALEARGLSSARDAPPGVASASATMAGAWVSVWATNLRLAPLELHATAIVRNADVALFRLSLPPGLPVQPERGVVNASLRLDHGPAAGTRLALDAGLTGVELRRPAHFVVAPALRLTAEDIGFGAGAVRVGRLTLAGERLTLEERTASAVRRWPVQGLAVEATGLSSRRQDAQGVASLRATVAGATVSVWVSQARLDPLELRTTTILRNVDLALLRLYLPADSPVRPLRGTVSATFQLDHAVADGTRLTGHAVVSDLEARSGAGGADLGVVAPALRLTVGGIHRRGPDLDAGRLELAGSATVAGARAGARLELTQLTLAAEGLTWPVRSPARLDFALRLRDGGELDGSGTARLTAPLPQVAWAAEVGLRMRGMELAPLAGWVPPAAGLTGQVRADLTASLDWAGALTARVQGQVGAARVALADGGRTLLAVREIEATGLDVAWPERIGLQRLRLVRPSALVERDRQARFPLAARLGPPAGGGAAAGDTPARRPPALAVAEVVVEEGSGTLVDQAGPAPVRLELPRLDLVVREVTWPQARPMGVHLGAALPGGGTLKAEGSVSAGPAVDLQLAVADADLALSQPYLGFRARLAGRLDGSLKVAGPLRPAVQLTVQGEAGLRKLVIADGDRPVLTTEQLRATGIDARWPERATIDRLHLRRSWALIQRDARGRFLLRELLERSEGGQPRPAAPSAPPAPSRPAFAFQLREGVLEQQAATIVDGSVSPPARFEVADARLLVHDLTWPALRPVKLQLTTPMPGGGRLETSAAAQLEPLRIDARAVLDAVALEPAQPYLPIEGRVAGQLSGDLSVRLAVAPTSVQVAGQARLQRFRLMDGDRPVVTVGQLEAARIEVDWPRRIAVGSVQLLRPRLLVERDRQGEFRLPRLITPRRAGHETPSSPPASAPGPAPAGRAPFPRIEIARLAMEGAAGRFVDLTTTPPYAEELSRLSLTITGLALDPAPRAAFTAGGVLGGGAFQLRGEAAGGDRPQVDLHLDLRDYVIPRANPYLDRFTAWLATRGSLTASAAYRLDGSRLDARHDLVVRGLEVTQADQRDEVQARLGLPLATLVSLLKDSRGEIRLSLPVSGDVSRREFDFREAMWSAVRSLAIRLLALPFSRFGSLFVTQDSRVEAVAIAPVFFVPGTARTASGMDAHLQHIAGYLRGAPAVTVRLRPIVTEADLHALKREQVLARLPAAGGEALAAARQAHRQRWPDRAPPLTLDAIVDELAAEEVLAEDAMKGLGGQRLEVVRQELTRRGSVDAARLAGRARLTPLVEADSFPRVEFDLRS